MTDEVQSIISYAEDITEAQAPDPLPAGDYPATIEKAERKTSNNTGNDYVSVTFRIATDDFPADYNPANAPDGVVLSYGRLSPENNIKARYGMKKFITAIGAPGGAEVNLLDWVGLRAVVSLTVGEYEGMPQNQIKAIKSA